ncbi:MAG: adenylosuccinate synthase [Verrucomicrobiales bacterium]
MANTILAGAQWGDEGKGKIIDYLTDTADVVIRSQGGNNAGHTVVAGEIKYILHLLPSGILHPSKTCVIGNGVVLDPLGLREEVERLRQQGVSISPENLLLSDAAHVVLPFHKAWDIWREDRSEGVKIGTTRRGIGPCYADKIHRVGLRVGMMLDLKSWEARLRQAFAENNARLSASGAAVLNVEEHLPALCEAAKMFAPYIQDTVSYLHQADAEGKRLLFEGAQGTFLDIDFGTYPYVTSSNTTAGGACTGSGFPPTRIQSVMGVTKAYTTRVGEGPFVTEADELGDMLHGLGREYGATTGRARRCGWLDGVALRYSGWVNGFDSLAVTNLDGLDSLESIPVCTHYECDGEQLLVPPSDLERLGRCRPVYENLPGWKCSLEAIRDFAELPEQAQNFLHRLAALAETPISLVSVGPDRVQTFHMPK